MTCLIGGHVPDRADDDAVAGVVNYIARRRPEGGDFSFRYGNTEHGGGADYQDMLRELELVPDIKA